MLKKAEAFIENFYKYALTFIFFPVLCTFAAISIFCTCMLNTDITLIKYYVSDSAIVNIIAIILILLIGVLIKKNRTFRSFYERVNADSSFFVRCRRICLAAIALTATFWVLSTQYMPQYDQKSIMDAVYSLHIGDNKIFTGGQYMSSAPHQLGLVWFYYAITFIFGAQNYVALQLLNVAALVIFWKELSDLCGFFGFSKFEQLLVTAMGIFFYPLTMYCSFIYGNLLGLAFSVLAIRLEFQFFKTYKIRYAAASAVAIAFGVMMKSNYVIFLIGMVIYAIFRLITDRKPVYLLLFAFIVSSYFIQAKLPVYLTQKNTDNALGQGISSWAYIAMSIAYNDTEDGWYTGYNWDSFAAAGHNTEKQAEMAQELIENSIEFYKSNPELCKEFFIKKTVSQWCNPDFQCYWIFQNTDNITSPGNIAYKISQFDNIYAGTAYLDVIQSVIYTGAVLYFIFNISKKGFTDALILAMIVFGGILFHTVWEAKSLYVLSYFVLLIPYCIGGFSAAVNRLSTLSDKKPELPVKNMIRPAAMCGVVIFSIFFTILYTSGKGRFLVEDTEQFQNYLNQKSNSVYFEDGCYTLSTSGGYKLGYGMQDGYFVPVMSLVEAADETSIVDITNYQEYYWFHFKSSFMLMTRTSYGEENRNTVLGIETELSDRQKWRIEDAGNGMVYIINDYQYLTYDENTMDIYTAPYNDHISQKWYINKI